MLAAAFATSVAPPPRAQHAGDLRDLPLVEVPPASPAWRSTPATRTLAVVLTGDGDWAKLVKGIADTLARSGTAVVALKSRAYLAKGNRSPDGTARDVERVVRRYTAR